MRKGTIYRTVKCTINDRWLKQHGTSIATDRQIGGASIMPRKISRCTWDFISSEEERTDYLMDSFEAGFRFGELFTLEHYLTRFIKIHFGLLKELNVKIIQLLGENLA